MRKGVNLFGYHKGWVFHFFNFYWIIISILVKTIRYIQLRIHHHASADIIILGPV